MIKFKLYDLNNQVRRYLSTGYDMYRFIMDVANDPTPQIWVSDGFKCNERRRDIYPEYKRGRTKAGEDVFAFLDFFKECLKHTNATFIEVPFYEADDVIAYLAETLPACHIYSTDADLWALKIHPNVTMEREDFKCVPEYTHLYKAIVGDASDNIKGVRGVGEAAFNKMLETGEVPPKVREAEKEVEVLLKVTSFMLPSKEDVEKGMRLGVRDDEALKKLIDSSGLVQQELDLPW